MIEGKCDCGAPFAVPESRINRPMACERCSRVVNPLSGEFLRDGVGAGDFDAQISMIAGRDRVGDIFFLGGGLDIEIGKLPGKPICLSTAKVSRSHAKLVRVGYRPSRWRIEDCNSTNGVYINDTKIKAPQELKSGDVIGIGDYRMKYVITEKDFSNLPPLDADATPGERQPGFGSKSSRRPAMNLKIPARMPSDDNALLTGKKNRRSEGLQGVLPLGIFPQPWQSSRRQSPVTMWIVAVLTVVATAVFIPVASSEHPHAQALNLMHWTGASTNTAASADGATARSASPSVTQSNSSSSAPRPIVTDEMDDEAISSLSVEELTWAATASDPHLADALLANSVNADTVGFHWYQLVTHAFVHRTPVQCAINVLFLLLLGLRINELLGSLKMAVIYPLLAAGSALVAMYLHSNDPLHPIAGASGAVMGLAGMYLVFFPISSIAIAIWLRLGFSRKARVYGTVFSIHGFWLVLLWLVISDALPYMISGKPNFVALKSHAAELAIGLLMGLALLVLRQVNGGGSDILSVLLGKRAWPLIGRPSSRSSGSSSSSTQSQREGLGAFNARLA